MSGETKPPILNGLPVLSRSDFTNDEEYSRYVASFVQDLRSRSPKISVDEIRRKREAAGLPAVSDSDILVIDPAITRKKSGQRIAKFLKQTGLDSKATTKLPDEEQ